MLNKTLIAYILLAAAASGFLWSGAEKYEAATDRYEILVAEMREVSGEIAVSDSISEMCSEALPWKPLAGWTPALKGGLPKGVDKRVAK